MVNSHLIIKDNKIPKPIIRNAMDNALKITFVRLLVITPYKILTLVYYYITE